MKVSINSMQEYSSADLTSISHDELLSRIGAQLGAVEDIVNYGPRFDGIVVARVVSCEKHSDADKLSVCLIDDGGAVKNIERNSDGFVQVVCGAPNVRDTLLVAWIPPGVVVPSTVEKDPFTLEVREIRGVKSNGMLASASELGISDNNDGLLEIDASEVGEDLAKPGTDFKKLYGLDDFVIDLENKMFTHRPDCFGSLGVARELAGITGQTFKSPDWYLEAKNLEVTSSLPFISKNEIPELVPRFMAQVVEGVSVGTSSIARQASLAKVGLKSINSVVDISNFYMQLTAQPTHTFDYDKIKALCNGEPTIFPRKAKPGETLALLNGKTIELTDDDIVIATDRQPVALAGVMGGSETEVDATTKNIIVECATFDMYAVRRMSMRHGLFTDAVTRYTKGQSPFQNEIVLAKILGEIEGQANAKIGIGVDFKESEGYSAVANREPLTISTAFINDRLGSSLTTGEIVELLRKVEFVVNEASDAVTIVTPEWRMDIELPEDIVEEVGRLYGFDKLPVTLPSRVSKPTARNLLLDARQTIRESLKAAGANEILSYSFVHGDLMRKTGTDPHEWAIHIRNAISPDLQYYRTSLMPSILDKVNGNIRSDLVRNDDNEFVLFEIGKAHVLKHVDEDGLPGEFERVALVVTADQKTASRKYSGSPYYQAKKYLDVLLKGLATYAPNETNDYPITSPYQIGRSAVVKISDEVFGIIGEFKKSVRDSLKLPEFTAGFELDISLMDKLLKQQGYSALPSKPKTQQDITFAVGEGTSYQTVFDAIAVRLQQEEVEHGYRSTLWPRDIFKTEDGKLRLTFRVWLNHFDKTLTTEEVNSMLERISTELEKRCGAERV